jgi:hypothetical protein
MNGVFLQGGGAKGAFQAGVLCALHDRGVEFHVVSGTSIGAINGYFVLKGAYKALKENWLNQGFPNDSVDINAPIIESSGALSHLNEVKAYTDKKEVQHFYVNFVPVVNGGLKHKWADIAHLTEGERFEIIRHSSLLPKSIGVNPFDGKYSLGDATERFKEDLKNGIYDDYVLDGGLLNNNFLEPFSEIKVDKLFMIAFKTTFEIPNYITERYSQDELCLITSDIMYEKTDTMNFDKDFIEKNFQRGYEIGTTVNL